MDIVVNDCSEDGSIGGRHPRSWLLGFFGSNVFVERSFRCCIVDGGDMVEELQIKIDLKNIKIVAVELHIPSKLKPIIWKLWSRRRLLNDWKRLNLFQLMVKLDGGVSIVTGKPESGEEAPWHRVLQLWLKKAKVEWETGEEGIRMEKHLRRLIGVQTNPREEHVKRH